MLNKTKLIVLDNLMYKVEEDGHKYQMHADQIRKACGLNEGKLPDNEENKTFRLENCTVLFLTKEDAKVKYPKAKRPYRMLVYCPNFSCNGRLIPAGKFHQHARMIHRKEVK
jgi:hypothetical protein